MEDWKQKLKIKRTTWFWIDKKSGEMVEGPFHTERIARAKMLAKYGEKDYDVVITDYDRRGWA